MEANDKPILIISWSVYPEQVASSLLIHNIAKALGEKVVVVGEVSGNKNDWDRINYPLYHINPHPFKVKKGQHFTKWLTFSKSLKTIDSIIKKHNCKAVLCPFPDEYYMHLAMKAATKHSLNFYPWFHNSYLENRTGLRLWLAKRLQPRFFNEAKKILTISEGLTEYYRNKYPDLEFATLQHGFNIPEVAYQDFKIDINKVVKFAYTGALSESCLDAAVRLAEVITANDKFEFHVFGERNVRLFVEHGIAEHRMKTYGFLEEEKFINALKVCDIMLLPHGFTGKRSQVEYQTIFPTRTIPLLHSNRPILLHSPENAYLTTFLQKRKAAFVITTRDKKEIEALIIDFINDQRLQVEVVQNAMKLSKNYCIEKVVEIIEKELV